MRLGPRILVVDDEEGMREFLELMLTRKGYEAVVTSNGLKALELLKSERFDIVIADIRMTPLSGIDVLREAKRLHPEIVVIMISAYASPDTAVEAMREGAYDYLPKPFDIDEMYRIIEEAWEKKKLLDDKTGSPIQDISEEIPLHFGLIVGESPEMFRVYDLIEKVAKVDSNVLIMGESGTGKELVARAIHKLSKRCDRPFVTVNCGGVPESLIESELFGYKKGAFTGALQDRKGLVEAAQGGTLFLDEIGELSSALQVRLLRLIQEKVIRRLGDNEDRQVDVRIISATHRDLEKMVIEGTFREDLYYRLNVIPIKIPALRDRQGDIPILAKYFLKLYSKRLGKNIQRISSYALDILKSYHFPGNVRELENIIERGVALERTCIILPESLTIATHRFKKPVTTFSSFFEKLPDLPPEGIYLDGLLETVEKHYLTQALAMSGGRKYKAAELLGMSFRSFRYRLSKYGFSVHGEGDDVVSSSLHPEE
ncbi:MAG: sigma-54 dependent transcriptional regulator [Syntrophobacterales bacterium]|nr:sigma-54 dependent transcriptional regulator [Syntrophobacterales bacterium]